MLAIAAVHVDGPLKHLVLRGEVRNNCCKQALPSSRRRAWPAGAQEPVAGGPHNRSCAEWSLRNRTSSADHSRDEMRATLLPRGSPAAFGDGRSKLSRTELVRPTGHAHIMVAVSAARSTRSGMDVRWRVFYNPCPIVKPPRRGYIPRDHGQRHGDGSSTSPRCQPGAHDVRSNSPD